MSSLPKNGSKKMKSLDFWKELKPLSPSDKFKVQEPSPFQFSINENGTWSLHPNQSLFFIETAWGPCPLQFDTAGKPYYQLQWALNFAISTKNFKKVTALLEQGSPLTSAFPKLNNGQPAYVVLTSRLEKNLSFSKLNNAFQTSLSSHHYDDVYLKDMLMHALMNKRFGVAEIIWNTLTEKSITLSDDEAQLTLLKFFSPVQRFGVGYEDQNKGDDVLWLTDKNLTEEKWMIEMTSRWCDRLIGERVFKTQITNSVGVQTASPSSKEKSTADITFDLYGSLLFHHEYEYFKLWRKKVIDRFDGHVPLSNMSWNCLSSSQGSFSQYPEGKWSTVEIVRFLHEEAKAIDMEKRHLESLPLSSIVPKNVRL